MISTERLNNLKKDAFSKKASLLISSHLAGRIILGEEYSSLILERLKKEYSNDIRILENIERRIKSEGLLVLKDYLDSITGRMEADFDFITDDGILNTEKRIEKNRYIVLDGIRSPYNLGAVARSAESFKIREMILADCPVNENHPKAKRTSLNTLSILKCKSLTKENAVKYIKQLALPVFALECGGRNIYDFKFPDEGIAVIGSEEFGVSSEMMKLCSERVTIPMFGAKGSLNVSVAAGIMLSMWSRI